MLRLLCSLCLALCFTALLYAENAPKFVELKGHTEGVMSAEFSPDGKKIVTGSNDRTARIWDSESGQELHKLNSFGLYAVFSPNGAKVITAGGHENVRIWDANTGRQLLKLERQRSLSDQFARTFINVIPEFGHSAAFSSDGKKIVTGGHGIILIWDAETGRELLQMTSGNRSVPLTAGFSPDGKKIVSTGHDVRDKTALIWDAVLGKEVLKLEGHTEEVVSASFSPDGKYIVTASNDQTARCWDADSGKELKQLEHTWSVVSAKFSPDGKRIVTASRSSNIIQIFDAESGKEIQKFETLPRGVRAVAFSPDGTKIVTGGLDSTARIWTLPTPPEEPPSADGGRQTAEIISPLDLPPDPNEEAELAALREKILAEERAKELALIEEERKIVPLVDKPENLIPLDPQDRIWITQDRKSVVLLGRVVLREGFLELLACRVRSKEHESILSVRVKPQLVHAALLATNARQGRPVQFAPTFVPASGDRIDITLRWNVSRRSLSGEEEIVRCEAPAQDWVWDMASPEHAKKPMTTHWVFSGSRTYQDAEGKNRYVADETGELFGLSNFVGSILDVPIESSADNTKLQFGCFTERIPPLDTPVTIIVTPRR